MNRPAARALIALALSCVALAACGGDSDEDKVRETAEALLNGDAGVCEKLTDEFLAEAFETKEACEKSAGEGATEGTIESVEIDGERATATVKEDDGTTTLRLVKQDGDWKVAGTR